MQILPVSPERLAEEVTDMVTARPGRVRLALDGPPPTHPERLAQHVTTALRARGRAVVVVASADYLRPASVRLEYGRSDPHEYLDSWLDEEGLRREALDPAAPGGSGRVLPRLWNPLVDRSYRDDYIDIPERGVVVLHGPLLLGRGLPLDLAVHLRMGPAALARSMPAPDRWMLPAYLRYSAENDPEGAADVLVMADHPDRLAMRRNRRDGG